MVIYDYTRFHETTETKIHDLGFVVITANGLEYFDFFTEAPHNYHYTATAWEATISGKRQRFRGK